MLIVFAPAGRAADVVLRAEVLPGLSVVRGTVSARGVGWTEALSRLPMPEDDLAARRTWPARPEQGSLHLEPTADPDTFAFTALIPRRYGAAGLVPGRGLFMNGLWHPVPLVGGRLSPLSWEVELRLPEGAAGALNGTVGEGTLSWSGRAERLALTVLPRAQVARVPSAAGELVVLQTGPRRRRWEQRLAQLFGEAWPLPRATQLVVVETPMYRRLARAGPGQLFLSDHALRLTDGLWRLHAAAVRRAMLEAALPIEDPWARALAAELVSAERRSEKNPRELLGFFAWIPQIDELLYDGNLPYYSELFDESHPGDPVLDDLAEILDPSGPPAAAARKLEARLGPEASARFRLALLEVGDLELAATAAGLAPAELTAWRAPCAEQDLRLDVRAAPAGEGWEIAVTREAPADAPPEMVVLEVDGERLGWDTAPGPDARSWRWPTRPRSVKLDPDGLAHQSSALGDTWPARWGAIVSAWIYELDLNNGRVAGFADLSFRQQYNSRWLVGLAAETDPRDLASVSAYGVAWFGPLLDRRTRPLRVGLALGPSLLDPAYSSTEQGALVFDTSAWIVWETRDDLVLPRHGTRLRLSGGAGLSGGELAWRSLYAGGTRLLPLGGRVVLAGTAGAGLAESALPHRQAGLGLSGVEPGTALGDRQAGAELELRWLAMKNGSLPAGVAWLSDLQLSAGLEAGWLRAEGGPLAAAGPTAGLATVWDVLGARPTLMGVWAAWPRWGSAAVVEGAPPRALLRFEQSF